MSSPPPKREKKDGEQFDAASLPISGVIRHTVDKVSKLGTKGSESPEYKFAGVPWKLYVEKAKIEDKYYIEVYLNGLTNKSRQWGIDVLPEFTIVNSDTAKSLSIHGERSTFQYNDDNNGQRFDHFDWNYMMEEKSGFVKNDKLNVEVRFTIVGMRGIMRNSQFDFMDSTEPRHDVTFVINDRKVHASRQFLAIHSPVFNAMFFNEKFDEKNKKEIPLPDINAEDLIEMLQVIHPSGREITDLSAGFLAKLGDRFQIKFLLDKVEKYLIDSSKLELTTKLLLSEKYRFITLQDIILENVESLADLREMKASDDYEKLSNETKVALLETIFSFKEEEDQ